MRFRARNFGLVAALGCALVTVVSAGARGRLLYNADDTEAAVVAAFVKKLVPAHFPRLAERKLRLVPFESQDTYFRTDVRKRDVLKSSKKRVYNLYFNRRAFTGELPEVALDAILTHELVHLEGYTKMSGMAIAKLGAKYLASPKFVVAYERETDLGALGFGKAEGLKAYREWIYPRLTPKDLAKKRRTYFTPQEIDAWVQAQREDADQ